MFPVELTKGYIFTEKNLKNFLHNKGDLIKNSPIGYYLGVFAVKNHFTRLTIYPLLFNNIIKITIYGDKDKIADLSEIIKSLEKSSPIHTTGAVSIDKEFIYEVYLYEDKSNISILEELTEKLGYYLKIAEVNKIE